MRIHSGLGVSDSTEKPNIRTRLISEAETVCSTGGVHIHKRHSPAGSPRSQIALHLGAGGRPETTQSSQTIRRSYAVTWAVAQENPHGVNLYRNPG